MVKKLWLPKNVITAFKKQEEKTKSNKKKIPDGMWQCGRCGKILKKDHACACYKGKYDKEKKIWIRLEEDDEDIGEIW